MTLDRWIVTAIGLALIGLVVWFFWLKRARGTAAVATAGGVQEATIVVKGGYTPDVILVRRGRPVRLVFRREETATCSEMVLLPDFDRSARLPTGQAVAVEFTPRQTGAYPFSCQMGMFHGTVIVE